ncbi:Sulfotransferase family protein [Monaibacterium marinum]|uniref:Sulfotransferase family protein n=1 Tax=Pontivivens marinum TaxID=1690039 RepID=A0A2C9CW63_9RHOB|nr:sulfotransferase [Monaibacterium marinum]SOH95460.1 Sulfotransferase family protein [Monaibacterium marinum]
MSDNIQIILIGGYGRSGSTLLEMLLLDRLKAASVGELKYLWQRGFIRGELCACGTPVNTCPFWGDVGGRVRSGADTDFTEVEALRLSVERHRMHFIHRDLKIPSTTYTQNRAAYIEILRGTIQAIAESSGCNIIIDSSKDPAHIDLMAEAFPGQVRLVHLVRDSRAVAYSFQTPKVRREVHWKTEMMGTNSLLRAAVTWNYINGALERIAGKAGLHRIRYEDLATDPTRMLDDLITYIDPATQDTADGTVSSHSVSGNPMRFSVSKREVRLDERWKQKFAGWRRAVVTALTLHRLLKYRFITFGSSSHEGK